MRSSLAPAGDDASRSAGRAAYRPKIAMISGLIERNRYGSMLCTMVARD
jgi:hypothetical protein